MIANRIKSLRESAGMTQAELAKQLGITRSGVNAWEMGVTVPSTQYIVELAQFFGVSTDYLLGLRNGASMDVSGLDVRDIEIVHKLIRHLREKNGVENSGEE